MPKTAACVPAASALGAADRLHFLDHLILYPLAFLAVSLPLSICPQAALLILVTALAAWGVSALVLTRWPVLRRVFQVFSSSVLTQGTRETGRRPVSTRRAA